MLTPLDIQNKELRRSFRGYNEGEVDEFLDQLAQDYEWLYLENQRLKEKLEDTEAGVARYQDMEQTIKDTLVMAQKNAEELRENAKREAELLLSESRQKANEVVKEAEEKACQLVGMAEERSDEIVKDAEIKVQSMISEYQWLDKQANIFRIKFRSFLQAQLDLLEKQEEETMAPLQEVAASGLSELSEYVEPETEEKEKENDFDKGFDT
ncbi:MAG: DivIVA domain-containing protein [Firmicutes bacterium]|nr:DivIVA domain-containing protein [Bacillota bacterium]